VERRDESVAADDPQLAAAALAVRQLS